MESLDPDARLLQNLALIYIALAHGTDQELDRAEVDVITRRLQAAQAGVARGTVGQAVREALEQYTREDAPQRIERAVRDLREAAPPSLRRQILKDLTEIARADDKFLYAEARFIGELVEAWKIDPADVVPEARIPWSLFGPADEDDAWTPLHDLTLLYVTLAHQTDDTLSRKEVNAITQKIGEWVPDAGSKVLRRLVRAVLNEYGKASGGRTFDEAVEAVSRALPPHQRTAVLDDLRYVALADGVLLVEERVMIEKLARAWESDAKG